MMLDAAVSYARRGWCVHPLKPRGKEPASPHGLLDATTDLEQIRSWWAEDPDYNVAVATNAPLYVIDVDGPVGQESLEALIKEHGALPDTLMASTGKGVHYFFTYEGSELGNSASKLGRAIDTRGHGGYVAVAPSIHPSGARYEWVNEGTPIASLPQWVVDELTKLVWLRPPDRQTMTADLHPWVEKAWNEVRERLRYAAEGQRNMELNNAAIQMGHWVGGGGIGYERVRQGLLEVACAIGLTQRESERTLKSGLEAGIKEPRYLPMVRMYGHESIEEVKRRSEPGTVQIRRGSSFERRKVNFFWGFRVPLGKLTILAGPSGVGKSYLTLALAAHVTAGAVLPDCGSKTLDGEVLFCSYEDDVEDTLGVRADLLGVDSDRVHFVTGVDTQSGITRPFGPTDVPRIVEFLEGNPQVKLVVIDPLGSFMGASVDANAENETRAVLQTLTDAAQRTGAAVIVVAHLKKTVGDVQEEFHRISGSQGITAISRSVLMVERDDDVRVVKHVKHNLTAKCPDITYTFAEYGFEWGRVRRSPKEITYWLNKIIAARGGRILEEDLAAEATMTGITEEEVRAGIGALGVWSELLGDRVFLRLPQ